MHACMYVYMYVCDACMYVCMGVMYVMYVCDVCMHDFMYASNVYIVFV